MKIYLVGGAVRDMMLNKKPHDKDYVVFGATEAEMLTKGFQQVGRGFPVFLHPETKEEYALARKDVKTGDKHNEFRFVFTPDITPEEDVKRRDFTCNALLFDEENKQIIDLVGGVEDIKNKLLRHVDTEHFGEDPLRVLRMCRFAAKLDFSVAAETMQLARKMVSEGALEYLPGERIWQEFMAAAQTEHFDVFISVMRQCGALKAILPEIEELWNIPEIIKHHPEKNSGEHTMLCLKLAANMSVRVKMAVLLHDIGKIMTPKEILSHHYKHENMAEPLINKICQRIKIPKDIQRFAQKCARNHMKFALINNMRPVKLIDFLDDLSRFKFDADLLDFIRVCRCDFFGRNQDENKIMQQQYEESAHRLLCNYRRQKKFHAQDMPNFAKLVHDENFKEELRLFRAKKII